MIVRLILSFVVSFAIGWLVVSLLWDAGVDGSRAQRLVAAFLGFGIGHGVTSSIAFLFLLAHGRADSSYALFEPVVLVCLLILFWRVRRRRPDSAMPAVTATQGAARPRGGWLLPAAFYTTAAMALSTIALRIWQAPHGGYDAWVIWNARAREIFRGGDAWRDTIWSTAIGHVQLDYPLLLPMSVVRAWMYAGAETTLAPALLAWLFTAATIGLLTAAVAALCSRSHGYVAGIVLLGYVYFILHANSQLAEAPLVLFYLGVLALIAFHNAMTAGDRGALVLAGLAAGLAAWTKNEGLLFLLALGLAHCVAVTCKAGPREYSRQLLALAAGLLPIAILIVYFKVQFAPPNIMMAEVSTPRTASQLLDASRYLAIGKQIAQRLTLYEGLGINMAYAMAILLACFGITRRHITSVAQIAMVVAIMFAGFMGIYVLTVANLGGFIVGSIDRLLLQLWPAFVFGFFLLAAPLERPGDMAAR